MENLEKNIYINKLFDLYGSLLTENQRNIIELYYCLNLSLGEISESKNISRNGVYDTLKKAEQALENYETNLHLLKNEEDINTFLDELKEGKSEKEIELISLIQGKVIKHGI